MKKILFALVVVLGVCAMLSNSFAEPTLHNSTVVTANSVVSAQGCTLYKISGYANAASAIYGVYNCASLNAYSTTGVVVTNCKFEGGEATQYDSLAPQGVIDFGPAGLAFPNGLTILVSGAYVTVEYE